MGSWPQIDTLIQVHMNALFFGAVPDSPKKFNNIFMLRLGATPSHGGFKESDAVKVQGIGGDRTGKRARTQARASCLSISDTADTARHWYDGKQPSIRTVHEIYGIMNQ